MDLRTPLSAVLRTQKPYLEALSGLGIETVGDLLLYFPRAHEDLTAMQSIGSAPLDEKSTIRGVVTGLKLVRTRTGKQLVTGMFTNGEGESIEVIWFNQPHIKRMLTVRRIASLATVVVGVEVFRPAGNIRMYRAIRIQFKVEVLHRRGGRGRGYNHRTLSSAASVEIEMISPAVNARSNISTSSIRPLNPTFV